MTKHNIDMFDEDVQDVPFSEKKTGKIQTFHNDAHAHSTSAAVRNNYPSCYESHPPVPIGPGFVYGGSCGWPKVKDADIYIGLDGSMGFMNTHRYPWHPEQDGPVEVLFRIPDGHAPKDAHEFKAMINWLSEQLLKGKKIHIGCIGGHGRTGMVIAALKRQVDGTEDAITWVRENYCHKAVESSSQVQFLADHYGIKKVQGSRGPIPVHPGHSRSKLKSADEVNDFDEFMERDTARRAQKATKVPGKALPPGERPAPPVGPITALPTASITNVWGKNARTIHVELVKRAKSDNMAMSQEGE
jgi:hypothetical protein